MDYCIMSLKEAIKLKAQVFQRQSSDEPMDCMEYYITCEILLEVLECVRYLHELNPPVIHRDLKPDNILIAHVIRNGRFVKLCDLGLITVHEMVEQSHTSGVGSPKYMAPEVISGRKYDTKADVYSISVIIEELFDADVNDSRDKYILHEWSDKYCNLLNVIKHTMQPVYDDRPTCAQIIEQYNEWAIDSTVVTNDVEFNEKLQQIKHKEWKLRIENMDSEPELWQLFYTFVCIKTKYFNITF
ncbi:putative mitogen-activated protein kinase kinase kinase 7-like [Oppia nitens]|uniref:putative mitogen-activated protein kinase kinase kinase 7-like n=1 Tax=Oppia nitens TaxID=1686743 RepID=UPI0023DAB727|nr:putative mitogen-activated protein kinase kinase kinase 7-like [Oppia nitens]